MATTVFEENAILATDITPINCGLFVSLFDDFFMLEDEIPFIHNFYSAFEKIFISPPAFIPVALKRRMLQYQAKY